MNVEDLPRVLLDEPGTQEPHEAGQTNDVYLAGFQLFDHLTVISFPLNPCRGNADGLIVALPGVG